MSITTLPPLANDYLARLDRASRRLPRATRRELRSEIEAHLAETLGPGATDAEVLTVLDRLGDPDEIVEAERPTRANERIGRGVQEWAAIWLLLLGGFVFGIGWIAGVILLWSSPAWTTREKWIGTLVVPGGLVTGLYGLAFGALGVSEVCVGAGNTAMRCSGGPSTLGAVLLLALMAFLVLGPICTAVFLARRAAG